MKTKYFVILILLFPFAIKALGTNGTVSGLPNRPPSTSSSNSCYSAYYSPDMIDSCSGNKYISDNKINYQTEGLRITFFNLNGKQLGNTIDVWNQQKIEYRSPSCAKTGRFLKCRVENVSFINQTPSRLDYYTGVVEKNSNTIVPTNGSYTYYVDINYDYKTNYNPLWYTKPSCYSNSSYNNAAFKSYFTSASIVAEYMKIAGVTSIDPYETSEYIFILEPIFRVATCASTQGIGPSILSVADFGYFVNKPYMKSINGNPYPIYNNFILNCDMPKTLMLENDASIKIMVGNTIKTAEFKVPKPPTYLDCYIKWEDRTINPVGYGMYLVYGNQVCRNCDTNRSAIVYHTINLEKPFLTITGETRTLDESSNWYQKESTIETNIYKQNPQYTVVLTPTVIKQIREENKNIKYSELSTATFIEFQKKYANIFK